MCQSTEFVKLYYRHVVDHVHHTLFVRKSDIVSVDITHAKDGEIQSILVSVREHQDARLETYILFHRTMNALELFHDLERQLKHPTVTDMVF